MSEYEYTAATSVDEAVSLLSARGDRAKLLAGGTDVLVQLRETHLEADLVVDIKRIPELNELRCDAKTGLRIGAAVPCSKLYGNADLCKLYPGVVDVARILGGWQIQSRASLGGNLCNSSPAADATPMLIAYNVTCRIAGPQGVRELPVEEFCTAPGKNVLARGELLVSLDFPPPGGKSSCRYQRFIPRNEMDIAVVGAGSFVQLDSSGETIERGRIGLGAVAPTPLYATDASNFLQGRPATLDTCTQAGELAKKIATPITDMRGPADYRKHLVAVLVKRTLLEAIERAKSA